MTLMKTFMCHHCKWVHGADPSLAQWYSLTNLDLSYNPLGGNASDPVLDGSGNPLNRLPDAWQVLNLEVLKVGGAVFAHHCQVFGHSCEKMDHR